VQREETACCSWIACRTGTSARGGSKRFNGFLEGCVGGFSAGWDLDGKVARGNGFPIGAFWVRGPYADLLGAGTHGDDLRAARPWRARWR